MAQRLEMVRRIAGEIEGYVVELGTDGRLLTLQLDELIAGVEPDRELIARDYLPAPTGRRVAHGRPTSWPSSTQLDALELLDLAAVARALGYARRRGPRRRGQPARLPAARPGAAAARALVVDRLVDHFGSLQKLLAASIDDLQAVDGRRRVARPQRPRGPVAAGRVLHPRALRLIRPASRSFLAIRASDLSSPSSSRCSACRR